MSGGFDSMITEWDILLFATIGAVSTRNRDPQRASRPFDAERDGFVMGEGAGIVVLEELTHARRREARVHAELLGYGSSLDAFRITDTPPDGAGAVQAMSRAIEDAGLRPEDVRYINAHGTSTPDNDHSETRAIKSVFGEHASCDTGQLHQVDDRASDRSGWGAGGGAVGSCHARRHRATHHQPRKHPDPECDLDYVPGSARKADVPVAMSNSFGFGGGNAVIVLGRGPTDGASRL